jgi:hypothetical protein
MKKHGEVEVYFHPSLNPALDGSESQLHAPFTLPAGKDLTVPLWSEAVWAPVPIWTRWRRERNSYSYRESNPDRPARSLVSKLSYPGIGPVCVYMALETEVRDLVLGQ